jgi:transposase InsO family protein
MKAHEAMFEVRAMCHVLGVSRSGYYAWRRRAPSQRNQANEELLAEIRKAHQSSRQTYGSPRVHAALRRQGILCGKNRVARLMRAHGIQGRMRRRSRPVTTQRAEGTLAAPNLLGQDFTSSRPNEKWVTDITYIDTAEGWLYLASVLDLYSRKVVGWSMADHMETSLVEDALLMALTRRQPAPGLLHHSDQGSQYTSIVYQQRLSRLKCQVSMSRVANCYDNAAMESFFSTLKLDCASGQFPSRTLARSAIFEYIEAWYNRRRLHSSLGYLSPEEFESLPSSDILSVH